MGGEEGGKVAWIECWRDRVFVLASRGRRYVESAKSRDFGFKGATG